MSSANGNNRKEAGTFHWLFPTLKRLNVPPQLIQNLLNQLDVRLVFTPTQRKLFATPFRDKQRRIARKFCARWTWPKRAPKIFGLASSWEFRRLEKLSSPKKFGALVAPTDELHQFKPSVLDEVGLYPCITFRWCCSEALPKL